MTVGFGFILCCKWLAFRSFRQGLHLIGSPRSRMLNHCLVSFRREKGQLQALHVRCSLVVREGLGSLRALRRVLSIVLMDDNPPPLTRIELQRKYPAYP